LDEIVRHPIERSEIGGEISRFEAALIQTRAQILEMQQRIAEAIGAKDAGIFDAHLLVVEDRTLIDEVLRKLEADPCNVEFVFQEVALHYSETLSKIDDPYLRERALDIQDVTRRVIRNLQGKAPKAFLAVSEPHILVAHNLTPSDTATMDRHVVLGFATDLGSRTSHTAIMARSLNIPSVVGLHNVAEKLETGSGSRYNSLLIIRPTPETLALWRARVPQRRGQQQLTQLRETKSTTRDGRHIVLSANIELPMRWTRSSKTGRGRWTLSDRVPLPQSLILPDEEEQYKNYLQVAQRPSASTIIRTLISAATSWLTASKPLMK
jgi:phosphotransferase system enzyme I (PtsI)